MPEDNLIRVENKRIYKLLFEKEKDGHQLSEMVKAVVDYVIPLLQTIYANMPEYTLHDETHSAKVLALMGKIIPEDVLNSLNEPELALLILSAYLHDIGMASSQKEREQIIKTDPDFQALFKSDQEKQRLIEESPDDHRLHTILEDMAYTELIRRRHVTRSHNFIEQHFRDGSFPLPEKWKNTRFVMYLTAICDSHGTSAAALKDEKRFPRNALILSGKRINVQYLALVLRMADLLDFDPDRTPLSLYEFAAPQDPVSIKEWAKHRSLVGWEVTPSHFEFSAICTSPQVQRATLQFLDLIEEERKETLALSKRIHDDIAKKYHFDFEDSVSKESVESDGTYKYSDFRFSLDYKKVMELLMGVKLYRDPCVALRELLQNAFDTLKHRQAAEPSGSGYRPQVTVTMDGGCLTVEDNGMGMDEYLFKKYFINIGNSYYSSADFKFNKEEIDITSEFGIGILSVFMIAESITVESWRVPDDPHQPYKPIYIEIPRAHDYFIQRESVRCAYGTKITLKLKDNIPLREDNLIATVKELAPFPAYPVKIAAASETCVFQEPEYTVLKEEPFLTIPLNDEFLEGKIFLTTEAEHAEHSDKRDIFFRVAQRGMRLDEIDILPTQLYAACHINIKKSGCLSLTPDRTTVLHDERKERLSEYLGTIMVEALEKQLSSFMGNHSSEEYYKYFYNFVYPLISFHTFVYGFTDPENFNKFFQMFKHFFPVKTLDQNGVYGYSSIHDIEKTEQKFMIHSDSFALTKNIDKLINEIKKYDSTFKIIILNSDTSNFFSNEEYKKTFINTLFQKSNSRIITGRAGVILYGFADCNFKSVMGANISYIIQKGNTNNVLLTIIKDYVFLNNSRSFSIDYNYGHNLLQIFNFDKYEQNSDFLACFNKLTGQLKNLFKMTHDFLISSSKDIDWHRAAQKYNDYNFTFIGVLQKRPDFLREIEMIFKAFWQDAKKQGFLPNNKRMPKLTADDFPWYWNAPPESWRDCYEY